MYQPTVDLTTGAVLGHEALTRFTSGRRPDLGFGAAHEVGLGIVLETAFALAAVRVASGLHTGAWLAVDLSPASVIAESVTSVASEARRWWSRSPSMSRC